MKKEGMKRILLWSVLLVISILLTVIGILKYNEGYGDDGKARELLNPLISEFNNLDEVINSDKYLKAKLNNKSLVVSYIIDGIKYELDYEYTSNSKYQYLSIVYNDNNTEIVENVSKILMELSSSLNGGTYGEIFKTYSYNYLRLFNKIDDGFELYRESDSESVLTFQLNVNISSILKDKLNETDEIKYITPTNIKDIYDELEKNNKFKYEKDSLYLYVVNNEESYDIYISDKNKDVSNIYSSIMSTIKILNTKLYDNIKDTTETFDSNQNKVGYTVDTNPELIDELKSMKRTFTKVTIEK